MQYKKIFPFQTMQQYTMLRQLLYGFTRSVLSILHANLILTPLLDNQTVNFQKDFLQSSASLPG